MTVSEAGSAAAWAAPLNPLDEGLRLRKLRRRGVFRGTRSLAVLSKAGADEVWTRHVLAADNAFRRRVLEVASEQGMATEGVQSILSDEALLRALAWYCAERAARNPDEAPVWLRMVPTCLAQARACARDAWELGQREGEALTRGGDAAEAAFRALAGSDALPTVPTEGEALVPPKPRPRLPEGSTGG